jgi:serine/threonine protein phosphatase 1
LGRLIAIGDIHGRLKKLEGLLGKISPQPDDQIVFLGDYIDRGAESYGVVELVLSLKADLENVVTLRGNHEDYVASLFFGNMNKRDLHIWLTMNGGNLTMSSYRRRSLYLKEHQDFYLNLLLSYETEHYFFCHAGVRPGVPLAEQKPSDLLEIRDRFLKSEADFGKVVVHGHHPVDKPDIRPNQINIDTGAGKYGPLTAIELPSLKIWQQL